MSSRRLFFLLLRSRPQPYIHRQSHSVRPLVPCRWISEAVSCIEAVQQATTLHELVSQGRYSEALDQWEQAKKNGVATPQLYSSVMQLAAQAGGTEAAQYVKEDMDKQDWNMDHSCSLHYLGCLASEGQISDVMRFIKSSHLKEEAPFLADCASLLLEKEHPQAALDVCSLSPPSPLHPHLSLLTVRLEAMGKLGRETEMETLVRNLYSNEDGVSRVPRDVELALANGFSLAGQPTRSLALLKNTKSRCVPMKCLTLLLESALRENAYTLAAEACSLFWNQSRLKPSEETLLSSPSSLSSHTHYHCRAITAAFYLQAHARREIGGDVSELLTRFLERNFFQELVHNKYAPSPDMYQALLLLSCYHDPALSWADQVIRLCRATGQEVPAASLTSWARGCGILTPQQALRVIHLIRTHRHSYQLDFDLCHYNDLLSIRYHCDTPTQQKAALDCIRAIRNSMEKWGILHSTEAYNLILQAVIRIPVVGAHYTTYNNMIAHQVEPNLHTFHILLDGTLAEGSVKNTKKAAYYLWRSLMKEWPRVQPDVELINKFIHCCLVCSDHERGLVFLSALSDCSVHPNLHTFSLLFKLCHSANDRQSFDNVLKLAQHCLPDQRTEISAMANKLQMQWRAEHDFNLAQSILSQLEVTKR